MKFVKTAQEILAEKMQEKIYKKFKYFLDNRYYIIYNK